MEAQENSVFLNGKAQVIEMLQYLNADERERILKHIRIKNPTLADELVTKSVNFDSISAISDNDLKQIFEYINPAILGLALKTVSSELQRRILSIAPRQYAEEAYGILVTPLANEMRDCKKAQTKIVNILISLKKRKMIQL